MCGRSLRPRLRVGSLSFAVLMGAAVLLGPAEAGAVTSQQAVGYLNAERAALGLPAGVVENATWSQDCALHNAYMQQNGGALTHAENPAAPGYTAGGAYAGGNSILSQGLDWAPGANPWENAPIHLIQLYTPSLAQIGIDSTNGYVCATTFPGFTRPPVSQDTVTTYPADGAQGVYPAENAGEGPFAGALVGHELFVYLDQASHQGFAQVQILAASLTGPSGPVDVRSVDNTTPQIGSYLTGAIISPAAPLASRATYTATVMVADGTTPITHSWTFTTAAIKRTVRVAVAGTGSGAVSSTPAGVSCGPTCSAQYDDGTLLVLHATPDTGSTFAGWSSPTCSGTADCTVTMNADQDISATFTATPTQTQPGTPHQVRCIVPSLRHMTLSHAKSALRRAHCRLGKVHRPRNAAHRPLRVSSQSPRAHTRHAADYPVNISLSA